MRVVNEAPVDFGEPCRVLFTERSSLMYIDFSGEIEDYVYSVCLLKRNINVNLTWSCKKSCEYPSISRHHLKVFGNKYEYCCMINILYITKQLLWASEPYQNSKWSFLFVSFFNLWLIFLCLFFFVFMSYVIYMFCFFKNIPPDRLLLIFAGIAIKEHILQLNSRDNALVICHRG